MYALDCPKLEPSISRMTAGGTAFRLAAYTAQGSAANWAGVCNSNNKDTMMTFQRDDAYATKVTHVIRCVCNVNEADGRWLYGDLDDI